MTTPLSVIIYSAVTVAALGTALLLAAFWMDKWEVLDYKIDSLSNLNSSSTIQVILPSQSNWYTEFRVLSGTVWTNYYLYPEYIDVWEQCDDLSDAARAQLLSLNVKKNQCYNFVIVYEEEYLFSPLTIEAKGLARLHNSAASCFIVAVINLIVAALVGILAISRKQVTAYMVTGVLYFVAGLFTIFGLTIFYTKVYYESIECHNFRQYPSSTCEAREVTVLWPVSLAWVGVFVCFVTCFIWLMLTSAVRIIKTKAMM